MSDTPEYVIYRPSRHGREWHILRWCINQYVPFAVCHEWDNAKRLIRHLTGEALR